MAGDLKRDAMTQRKKLTFWADENDDSLVREVIAGQEVTRSR